MKKALTIGLAGVALAATLSFVAAGSRQAEPEPVAAADALPSYEILATIREMGLNPIGQPVRRGPYYVLHAYDPRGIEVRVVADAQFGDVLSVVPARALNATFVPQYERGPRIIHVPQPGERDDDANSAERDEPTVSNDDDDERAAPPPRPRATPKPRNRSDGPPPPAPRRKLFSTTPPPPAQRRAVLSAPPPSADKSLTPIYPTPRFNASAESGDKFAPPKDAAIAPSAPPPPIGTTPPAADSTPAAPEQSTQPDDIH